MSTIRTYSKWIDAREAGDYLRTHGIACRVSMPPDMVRMEYTVDIERQDEDRAEALLLSEFDKQRAVPEVGWEADTCPDLSRLSADLAPECPQCGVRLPLDGSVTECPGCGGGIDVCELIVQQRGADVLASLYPDGSENIERGTMETAELACRECQYPLKGLPDSGRCPECGKEYSKKEMMWGE